MTTRRSSWVPGFWLGAWVWDDVADALRAEGVPEPGGVLRDTVELTNDARLDIPSTLICTGYSSQEYREAMGEGHAWLAGLQEIRNITWVDLPDEPLADVVASEGARQDHRRRRAGAGRQLVASS
jgi:hypothetical protein